jgi:hypothetical protein
MGWRFIETFDPAVHANGMAPEFLLAGTYPNGVQWTSAAYWDSRGWFSGHKTDTFKPTHWQPMPEPPTSEEDEIARDFMAMIG